MDGETENKSIQNMAELRAQADALFDAGDYLGAAKLYQQKLQDLPHAAACYQKAADVGMAKAYNPLALAYKNGEGVDVDFGKANEYAQKGADAGEILCIINLASWLIKGETGITDLGKAKVLLDQAKANSAYSSNAKVKARVDSLSASLETADPLQNVVAMEPVAKKDDTRGWFFGFYGVMIVLGIAGCILAAFAASQLKQPGWHGLYALFGTMVVGNVVPMVWKKLRFNSIHLYIDFALAFIYIVAIVVCAIVWYKAKGL